MRLGLAGVLVEARANGGILVGEARNGFIVIARSLWAGRARSFGQRPCLMRRPLCLAKPVPKLRAFVGLGTCGNGADAQSAARCLPAFPLQSPEAARFPFDIR